MKSPSSNRCSEEVHDGGRMVTFHQCYNEAFKDGLCKYHIAVRERRAKKDRQWRSEEQQSDANYKEVEEALARLGIEGRPFYNHAKRGLHNYERKAVIDLDVLLKYIENILGNKC